MVTTSLFTKANRNGDKHKDHFFLMGRLSERCRCLSTNRLGETGSGERDGLFDLELNMAEKDIPVELGYERQCVCGKWNHWEDYENRERCNCGRVLRMVPKTNKSEGDNLEGDKK